MRLWRWARQGCGTQVPKAKEVEPERLWLHRSYHDWDVQDPQLLFRWLMLGLFSRVLPREAWGPVLVVDVKKQSAIFQPLLPPAHQRDVLRVPWDL